MTLLRSADGNIYFIPNILESIANNYRFRGWMNQTWLTNLGLKMPETTAEFRTVLEAFRDRDPNGNGLKDEIPAIGTNNDVGLLTDFLLNSFIYDDIRNRLVVDNNGRVDVIYNKPEYRDGLRYVNSLWNDGLIFDQLFTLTGLREINESLEGNTITGFMTVGFAGAFAPYSEMRLNYVPMAPLRGPQGARWATYIAYAPAPNFVITKDCKNPEAAFRLGDYMCSEDMSIWNRFGRPEIDWRTPRPGEKSMYDSVGISAMLAPILVWGQIQNSHWGAAAPCLSYLGITDGQVAPDNPLDNEIWVAAATLANMPYVPPERNRVDFTIFDARETDELGDLQNSINTYVNENQAFFVTGQKSIDRDWDAYVRELDRIGLQRYIAIQQSGYERAIGKK